MPDVTIELAGPERRETLENLFQLYVHDFSDFLANQVDLQEDGRFPPYPPLDAYWREPGREVLLIHADGALAGFALVNREAHSGEPCDFSMAEFFVVRKYRRAGVGQTAALAVIAARPGQWDIAVARRNLPAQVFWRGVAAAMAGAHVEELDLRDSRWNGIVIRLLSSRSGGKIDGNSY